MIIQALHLTGEKRRGFAIIDYGSRRVVRHAGR